MNRKMIRRLFTILLLSLALVACGGPSALERAETAVGEGDYETALTEFNTALEEELSAADQFRALSGRAGVYEQQSNVDGALADYNSAAGLVDAEGNPAGDAGAMLRNRIRLFLAGEDVASAAAEYDRVIALEPSNTAAMLEQAALFGQLEDWNAAIASYDNVLTAEPGNSDALGQRGYAHLQLRNFEEAIADLKASLQSQVDDATGEVAAERGRDLVSAYFSLGQALYDLGDIEGALGNYNEALAISTNDDDTADIMAERGFIQSELGDYDSALADLDNAIEMQPDLAIAYAYRSYVFSDQENYQAAIVDAGKAVELGSDLSEATRSALLHARAYALINEGQLDEAIADATESINLAGIDDPSAARTYNMRARANRLNGDLAAAIADASKAIEIGATDIGALDGFYYQRSRAYYESGDYAAAIADQEASMEVVETPTAVDYEYLGDIYWAQEDYTNAIASYQTAIELDPSSPWLQNYLGDLYYEIDELENAEAAYRAAIAIDNSVSLFHENLALTLRWQDRFEDAVTAYSDALGLDADLPYSYFGRGVSYYFLGDDASAITDLEQALQYDIGENLTGIINELLTEMGQ